MNHAEFAEQYLTKIAPPTRVARIITKTGDVATINALGCKLFGPNSPGINLWMISSNGDGKLFIVVGCDMLNNSGITHGIIANQFTVSYGWMRGGKHSSIIWDKE